MIIDLDAGRVARAPYLEMRTLGESQQLLLDLGPAVGRVANYCDHAEHNEPVEQTWVTAAAEHIRATVSRYAAAHNLHLLDLYGDYLENAAPTRTDLGNAARIAGSWRFLQLVQIEFDTLYAADLRSRTRSNQLRACTLRLTELIGTLANTEAKKEMPQTMAAFLVEGLRLSTMMSEKLPGEPLQLHRDADDDASPVEPLDPDDDSLLDRAKEIVVSEQAASVSLLHRRLRISYTRAGRLIDTLERRGIIGPFNGSRPRGFLLRRQSQRGSNDPVDIRALGDRDALVAQLQDTGICWLPGAPSLSQVDAFVAKLGINPNLVTLSAGSHSVGLRVTGGVA